MTIARIIREITELVFLCWWHELITPREVAQKVEYMLQRAITNYPRKASA